MKKIGFAAVLAAMLVVPAGGVAAPTKADSKAASKECHALRTAAGSKENFQLLGYKNFGDCVSKKSREEAAERRAARRAARQACEDQGLQGREFGACVRSTAKENKADADAQDKNTVNAAKTCRTEQAGDKDAFAQKYGKPAGAKNAFGRCVSQTAKAKNDEQETETETTA
jgi:hypothetical protein